MSETLAAAPAFTVDRDAFADALTFVHGAVHRRPSVPVLSGVLITAEADSVTLAVFDYDQARTVRLAADVTRPGVALTGCLALRDIAKGLPKRTRVQFDATVTDVAVQSGGSAFKLPLMTVADYPQIPAPAPGIGMADVHTLAATLSRAAVALGTDAALPILTLFEVTPTANATLEIAATDRCRMTFATVAWQPASSDTTAMLWSGKLATDVVKAYARTAGKTAATVTIGRAVGTFSLSCGAYTTTFREPDNGSFPPLRGLLPGSYAESGTVDGAALAATVKRLTPMVTDYQRMWLAWTPNSMIVEVVQGTDVIACETLPCEYSGDPMAIAFNPAYLADAVATAVAGAIGRPKSTPVPVTFGFNGPAKPAVITYGADGGDSFRHLLMPLTGQVRTPKPAPVPAVDVSDATQASHQDSPAVEPTRLPVLVGMRTSWGAAQTVEKVAPGVVRVSTASHGGIRLDPDLNRQVHKAWRNIGGWYEEDCEWAFVALTFPQQFTPEVVETARTAAINWYPDQYEAVFGVTVTAAESHTRREQEFRKANAERWVVASAWGYRNNCHKRVPVGMVGVLARRPVDGGKGEERWYLVPEEQYDARDGSFVVDEAAHVVWPQLADDPPAPVELAPFDLAADPGPVPGAERHPYTQTPDAEYKHLVTAVCGCGEWALAGRARPTLAQLEYAQHVGQVLAAETYGAGGSELAQRDEESPDQLTGWMDFLTTV